MPEGLWLQIWTRGICYKTVCFHFRSLLLVSCSIFPRLALLSTTPAVRYQSQFVLVWVTTAHRSLRLFYVQSILHEGEGCGDCNHDPFPIFY
jgi:hypothetical protein